MLVGSFLISLFYSASDMIKSFCFLFLYPFFHVLFYFFGNKTTCTPLNYLEMARKKDGLEDLDNTEFLIVVPIDHIDRGPCWNPHDISMLHVKALSLLLPHQCYSSSSWSHIKIDEHQKFQDLRTTHYT